MIKKKLNNYLNFDVKVLYFKILILTIFIFLLNVFVDYRSLIISIYYSFVIFSFIFNGFRFSNDKYIRAIEELSITMILIYIFYKMITWSMPQIYCSDGSENTIHSTVSTNTGNAKAGVTLDSNSGNVKLDVEIPSNIVDSTIKTAVKGIENIGLGASFGGVASAVANASQGLPPSTRIGATVIGGIAGGVTYAGIQHISRQQELSKKVNTSSNSPIINDTHPSPGGGDFTAQSPLELNLFSDTLNTNILDSSPLEGIINTIYILYLCSLVLIKGGSPASRGFVIASTLAADSISKVINNTINDPNFVRSHVDSWKTIFKSNDTVSVTVDDETSNSMRTALESQNATKNVNQIDSQTLTSSDNLNKFIPDSNGLEDLSNKIVSNIMDFIRPILEPVQVSYSNEVLANQIHDLSILLFILSILIYILFISFIFNILVLINSDRILNYFTNKYIRWYVNFNKKIISIEVVFLSGSIFYFMYILSYGILFIATHPITFP